jgi:uncharacterized membrane protein
VSDIRVTGPIQVFVIGFDNFQPTGRIAEELRRVRHRGLIRVIDLLFVRKDAHGNVTTSMHMTDLSEQERQNLGAIAGSLIGLQSDGIEGAMLGADMGALAVAERDAGMNSEQLSDLADAIPPDSAGAILVVEHHWATHLRDAIRGAGGRTLMQAMITPDALVMVGAELNAAIEAQEAIEAAEAVKLAAAVDIVQTLAAAELIEEAALLEAAEVVAFALAVKDAAAEEATNALLAAGIIEEAAREEAAEVVAASLEIQAAAAEAAEEAIEEAEDVVAAAEEVKKAAALEALRALVARVIEEGAAEEAIRALITAEIIEEEAAQEALDTVLAS